MKKEIEINERIESFLNGDMTPEESGEFRHLMESDPTLAGQVGQHKQVRILITESAYIDIRHDLEKIRLLRVKRLKRIKRASGYGFGGLAICIVAFLVFRNVSVDQKITRPRDPEPAIQDLREEPLPGPATRPIPDSAEYRNFAAKSPETYKLPMADEHTEQRDTLVLGQIPAIANIPDAAVIRGADPLPRTAKPPEKNLPVPVTDCSKIRIRAEFITRESCNNKPTGSFVIDRQSLSGGRPPYSFSLNRIAFLDTAIFAGLYPGNYPVYVKDGDNCILLLGTALIGSVDCTYQAVFAPLKGETWLIPSDPGSDGTIRIISKAGMLVYSLDMKAGETHAWTGETISGQQLPMGVYQFEIEYSNGNSFTGNVTIVR